MSFFVSISKYKLFLGYNKYSILYIILKWFQFDT